MSELSKGEQLRDAIEEFNANSGVIDKKPHFLKRIDKYNIRYHKEKTTEGGNIIETNLGYYGKLDMALKKLLKEINSMDWSDRNLKGFNGFDKYKDVRAEDFVKDIQEDILIDFDNISKQFKKNIKKNL